MNFNEQDIKAAVYGGTILGGGGGGDMEAGLQFAHLAYQYGHPEFCQLSELEDDDVLITVAGVGAPAAKDRYVKPGDYVHAVQMLIEAVDGPVAGIITNENGGMTTLNGFLQSAVLGLPVVDAPCNGRAHPIGSMGSMGLHALDGYVTAQAACGGNPEQDRYHELVIRGTVSSCASIVRELAVQAGGLVAVARNPVPVSYVKEHGAVGAISQAIEVGRQMLAQKEGGPVEMARGAASALNGEVAVTGRVTELSLVTRGGFDVGVAHLEDASGQIFEMTFWNEYMTLEKGKAGERMATFPDLIMTVSLDNGDPLTSANLRKGDKVAVIVSDQKNLSLGSGMYDSALYRRAEEAVDKPIISYLEGRVFHA